MWSPALGPGRHSPMAKEEPPFPPHNVWRTEAGARGGGGIGLGGMPAGANTDAGPSAGGKLCVAGKDNIGTLEKEQDDCSCCMRLKKDRDSSRGSVSYSWPAVSNLSIGKRKRHSSDTRYRKIIQ